MYVQHWPRVDRWSVYVLEFFFVQHRSESFQVDAFCANNNNKNERILKMNDFFFLAFPIFRHRRSIFSADVSGYRAAAVVVPISRDIL